MLFFIVVLAVFSPHLVPADEKPKTLSPDFILKSNNGKNMQLSKQRGGGGGLLCLIFVPQDAKMPYLEVLYKKYKHLSFTVWGLNVDGNSGNAKNLLEDTQISFPILYDSKKYELETMPYTYMIDRNGHIRFATSRLSYNSQVIPYRLRDLFNSSAAAGVIYPL